MVARPQLHRLFLDQSGFGVTHPLRVYVIHPRSQGHRQQPGQGSRCLDLEPSACVHGTPWSQLSGLFWAPSHASCLLASMPGAGEAVWLKVTLVVSWLLGSQLPCVGLSSTR